MYCYNGTQWCKQFLEVSWLDRALILLGQLSIFQAPAVHLLTSLSWSWSIDVTIVQPIYSQSLTATVVIVFLLTNKQTNERDDATRKQHRDSYTWMRNASSCIVVISCRPTLYIVTVVTWPLESWAWLDWPLTWFTITARRVCIAQTMPWHDVCPSVCPSVRHTMTFCRNG